MNSLIPTNLNKTARNERVKLTATWLNGAAIAALAIGCFAPITAVVTANSQIPFLTLNLLVGGWLCISIALHFAARATLRRIEE